MRIVEQTLTKLKLQQRPIWWLLGIWFIAYGIYHFLTGIGLSTMELSTLTCQRIGLTQVRCELVSSNIIGSELRKISLNQLQGAKVEKAKFSDDSDDGVLSYRVILLTSSGEVPFTLYPNLVFGYQPEKAIAFRINHYLNNSEETFLMVQEDHRWFVLIFAGFLTLLFFLLIGIPTVVTCTLNKTLDSLTIERRNFFSVRVIKHSLQEIADVRVEEYSGAEDTTYRISFVLTSGECVPLTRYYSSDWKTKQEWAKYICNFVNSDTSTANYSTTNNIGSVKFDWWFSSFFLEKIQAIYKGNNSHQVCPFCQGYRKQYTIVQTNLGKFKKVTQCPKCNGTNL